MAQTHASEATQYNALRRAVLVFRRHPMLAIIPVIMFVAATLGTSITTGPIICVFRLGSGLPCAGCGMTRAFVALSHGHGHAALHYNLLSPIVFGWMWLWWIAAIVALATDRDPPRHPGWLVKSALVALTTYWLVRAGWFAAQPGAWQDMVDTSPVLRAINWLMS
ncbi:MAG: DUF2752 domain-containing protein [Myxococcales bacterium]|nr:DUF2752 domain-containing protein [Myxococcales bacterium]